jgi:hypothetical protein
MRPISLHDITAALAHCDPDALARALTAADPENLTRISDAVAIAARHHSTYPRDDVLAEADALLFDVLRWPIADATPAGLETLAVDDLAHLSGRDPDDARALLTRLAASESHAVRRLLDSGAEPNFTLEQTQVMACIHDLVDTGQIPTRQGVRDHAWTHASRALGPGGPSPIVYTPGLPPRIVSPSPRVHAVLWLDRMEASPPPIARLDDRITYVLQAKDGMAAAAFTVARISAIEHHAPDPTAPATSVRPQLGMAV